MNDRVFAFPDTLVDEFTALKAKMLIAISTAFDGKEIKLHALKGIAHRLAGAGGLFGEPALSDVCKDLVTAIEANDGITARGHARTIVDLIGSSGVVSPRSGQ